MFTFGKWTRPEGGMRRIQFLRLPPSEAVHPEDGNHILPPRQSGSQGLLTFLFFDAILKSMNAALWRDENE